MYCVSTVLYHFLPLSLIIIITYHHRFFRISQCVWFIRQTEGIWQTNCLFPRTAYACPQEQRSLQLFQSVDECSKSALAGILSSPRPRLVIYQGHRPRQLFAYPKLKCLSLSTTTYCSQHFLSVFINGSWLSYKTNTSPQKAGLHDDVSRKRRVN